jgi:hypothetical protein
MELVRTYTAENVPTYSVRTNDGKVYPCKRWLGNSLGHWNDKGEWVVVIPGEWFVVLPSEVVRQTRRKYVAETKITEDVYKLEVIR